jgi:hypothetical protein
MHAILEFLPFDALRARMHHSHAKRKEANMKAKETEIIRIDPEVVAVLQARARRARSEAVHNLILSLIDRLTPRPAFRPWGAHWG